MKLNVEKKIVLTVALCALAIVVIVGGLIWPLVRSIEKIAADTQAHKNSLQTRSGGPLTLRAAIKKASQAREYLSSQNYRLFKKGDELQLITTLEQIAAAAHVTAAITQSNLDTPARTENTIVLTVSGSYANILAYLDRLENSPYFIIIERLILTPSGNAAASAAAPDVEAALVISVYVSD